MKLFNVNQKKIKDKIGTSAGPNHFTKDPIFPSQGIMLYYIYIYIYYYYYYYYYIYIGIMFTIVAKQFCNTPKAKAPYFLLVY